MTKHKRKAFSLFIYYFPYLIFPFFRSIAVIGTFEFSWPIPCADWANDSEFSNINSITIRYEEMWIPTIMHYNSVDSYYLNADNMSIRHIFVYPQVVYSYMAGIFTSKCVFHFQNFPFDSQKCNITLEGFENTKFILLNPENISYPPQNDVVGDFMFDYSKVQIYSRNRTSGQSQYSFAVYEFHFSRKSEYYVINIIIPIISMMTLQHAALLIPISSERCSFLLTILLSIFLIQSVVDGIISHFSETPRLAYLLLGFTVSSTVLCLYSIAMLMLLKGKFNFLEEKIGLKCVTVKLIRSFDGLVFILSVASSIAMTVFTFQ